MVRPWALAPIRRLVLVLLAVTASHHGHWAAASPTLCGGWWVSSHYSLYTTLYLLSKLTMRKVRTGRQLVSPAGRQADNVTIVQYSFTHHHPLPCLSQVFSLFKVSNIYIYDIWTPTMIYIFILVSLLN